MEKQKKISMLYFYTRDEMLRVDLRKVGYFQADRNYTDVYFLNGYRATLPTNLMAIEQMLDDDRMYGAQNEAYMSRSAEKWVRGLCFNELGVCG